MGVIADLRRRRDARRWQRWTEVEPEEELHRRAGVVTAIGVALFALLIAVVVVGLVAAR
jgi:hypothetical protein